MATVRIIINKQYESKDGYQVVYKIANRGKHSHLPCGVAIPEKYWDEKKLIKRNAPGILDYSYKNAQLNKEISEIYAFVNRLTDSGEIYELTASQIKERYLKEKTKNSYNFNTGVRYELPGGKSSIPFTWVHLFLECEQRNITSLLQPFNCNGCTQKKK